jgi:phosphoglycolate phosphatase-like HAD superfamily hydrolase
MMKGPEAMDTPAIWKRPDLVMPPLFDSIFFDVDGVLMSAAESFRAAVIATTAYVVGELQGLDWGQNEGKVLVTQMDVEAFKRAGGFNDDFTMSYLLSSLYTARLREWRGTPLAERSSAEWAALAREAQLQGRGSRAWIEDVIPASARIDFGIISDLLPEYYWGAQELRKWFGREPHYLPHFEGYVHNERLLFAADFFSRLRASGIKHLGMITGRMGAEVDRALEQFHAYCGERWWEVVVPATLYAKPDPQALRYAMATVGTQGGLYIGDTADDLDLVLNYRASQQAGEPPMLVAMVAHGDVVDLYRERGADLIVSSVEGLLAFARV